MITMYTVIEHTVYFLVNDGLHVLLEKLYLLCFHFQGKALLGDIKLVITLR